MGSNPTASAINIRLIMSKNIYLIMSDLYEVPKISINEDIGVSSRLKHIDEDLMPIAKFVMEYASWNLHKDEWNHPVLEVPLFRVLDALVQRGKPYCEG